MKKRLFSILLALCMVLCLVPTTAFAESETEETPVCSCETACTEETMNTECPVCGAEGALAENCGKYVEPAAEGVASQPEGEKTQENQDSNMPDTQSEAALAQVSGEGENGIAVQSAGVAIDDTNFPDANFRTVVKKFDTNQDSSLSDTEIAAVKKINCSNKGITNLKGIEYFTSLNILLCTDNQLTALDVSENTALTELDCRFNKLTALDVSKNTALTKLYCNENRLTALDVSKNTALLYLICVVNQLTSLDVSKNTALTDLNCSNNELTALDVSKNTALTVLRSNHNQLTTLDVSKNTALLYLSCTSNQLTSLDLNNTKITNDPNCRNNIYQIVVDNDPTFDLSTLPGNFVVAKASDWSGGTVSGNMLTVDSGKDTVTYKYDCGKGKNVTFTLKFVGLFADYTKVDEAITKAKALNKDDYKDFSAVDSAVNAVVRDKNVTEQSEVDKMAKAIEDAIAALQYKDADYTKVDAAIAKANALNKDDYKDFSAVESAINAVVRDKNITEQSEVDKMAKVIEDAIAALKYKDADYTKVDEAIAKANALNKNDYKDFTGVEAAVNAVVRGKNLTEQTEVDAMAKAIEDAIAALVYKDADYTKVDAAIAKANALKKDEYKDFSGVEAAVNAVVRGKNITEQSEVDAMAKAIEDAIAALEKKSASTKPGTSDKSPQTGDTSNIALWIALLFVSGGAAIGTTVVSRKKKYNK